MNIIENPVFLLLLIICLGELLGKIRIGSFSFGSSAIIFVSLGFGHYGFKLPDEFQLLGLILFIYAVGLQAGPGFLSSFRKNGLLLALGAITIVSTGFLLTLLFSILFHFNAGIAAGLFAGALTSTPGLAVAVEGVENSLAPAAYGMTYCFGVIGVILFINLIPKLTKVNIADEEQLLASELLEKNPPITVHHIELTNGNLFGKTVNKIFLGNIAPVVITRLLRKGATEPILVNGETKLAEGDHLRLVGRAKDLEKVELYMGKPIPSEIEFNNRLDKKRIVVSKNDVIGRTIGYLNLKEAFNVQITRIIRNGIELPPTSQTRLRMGDILHIVGDKSSLKNITRILGDNVQATYQANLFSLLIGLCLGLLLGKLSFPFPFLGKIALGTTGGVLVTGLILSNIYKTGPFIWQIPGNINRFIRDLGLVLFLAAVGTKTGATMATTFANHGISLFFSGMMVTLGPLIVSFFLCRKTFGIPLLRTLGVLTGGMTSTPGLAAATSLSDTHYASSAYATVYPVALIGMILFTKILILIVSVF